VTQWIECRIQEDEEEEEEISVDDSGTSLGIFSKKSSANEEGRGKFHSHMVRRNAIMAIPRRAARGWLEPGKSGDLNQSRGRLGAFPVRDGRKTRDLSLLAALGGGNDKPTIPAACFRT